MRQGLRGASERAPSGLAGHLSCHCMSLLPLTRPRGHQQWPLPGTRGPSPSVTSPTFLSLPHLRQEPREVSSVGHQPRHPWWLRGGQVCTCFSCEPGPCLRAAPLPTGRCEYRRGQNPELGISQRSSFYRDNCHLRHFGTENGGCERWL